MEMDSGPVLLGVSLSTGQEISWEERLRHHRFISSRT